MRTTVTLTPDVAKAVEQLQREKGLDVSEALNALVRGSLLRASNKAGKPFTQRTKNLGLKVDISNIGKVLESLER